MFYKFLGEDTIFETDRIYALDIISDTSGQINIRVINIFTQIGVEPGQQYNKYYTIPYQNYAKFKENWESVYERGE